MGSKRKRAAKEATNSAQPSKKRPKNESHTQNKKPTADLLSDKAPFVENPAGDDRKREAALYELLGSEDSDDRIAAADAIVSGLLGGEGVTEAVLDRHLDRRLFRGLASGRNAARLGFSLALTEILAQLFDKPALADKRYPGLTFDWVLGILRDRTTSGGNVPGQEERDHYFGQLFGIECFVKAEVLFSESSRWLTVLDMLVKLAHKKVWLRSQCGWVIVQAVPQMNQKTAEQTLKKIADEGLAKTPEGVGIWIATLDRFPDLKVPSKPWRNPLSSKHLGDVSTVLREGGKETAIDGELVKNKHKQSIWTAQLHFVWDIIVDHYVNLAGEATVEFKLFWDRVVDDGLFSRKASDNQKFSGFMVFGKMLDGFSRVTSSPLVDTSARNPLVKSLFSKNFMLCLMNQAAKEDRYLHRAAMKALKTVDNAAESNPSLLEDLLQNLLWNHNGYHGAYNFDQRTSTKTVEKLLQRTQPLSAVLDILKLPFAEPAKDQDLSQLLRSYSDNLLILAGLPHPPSSRISDLSIPTAAASDLAKIAFRKPSADPLTNISRELLRSRFMSACAKLAKRPENFAGLVHVVSCISPDAREMSEPIALQLQEARERLQSLTVPKKSTRDRRGPYRELALLYAVGILQVYNEEPDAVDILDDLNQCFNKLKEGKYNTDDSFSEILVEILLSLVARPSPLMRQVSQQVFEASAHLMSASAIGLLTDPLSAEESSKGHQGLFSNEDDDMDGDEEDGGSGEDMDGEFDGEIDSDVEFVGLQNGGVDGEGHDDDDEDEDDDEDDEETRELEGLDDALAKVLRSHRLDKDNNAESSSDESDMSDSEMLNLDDTLAEVFRQRTKGSNKKKDDKSAKESVVNFKHRILSLLDIYIKKEAGNPVAFSTLLPLLRLIRTSTTKALADHACGAIQDFGKSLKKARSGSEVPAQVDVDALMNLLREIHAEAATDPSHAFARAASAASLAVASQLFAASKENIRGIVALYAQTQAEWTLGKIRVQPAFFTEWINWCQSRASNAPAS